MIGLRVLCVHNNKEREFYVFEAIRIESFMLSKALDTTTTTTICLQQHHVCIDDMGSWVGGCF